MRGSLGNMNNEGLKYLTLLFIQFYIQNTIELRTLNEFPDNIKIEMIRMALMAHVITINYVINML